MPPPQVDGGIFACYTSCMIETLVLLAFISVSLAPLIAIIVTILAAPKRKAAANSVRLARSFDELAPQPPLNLLLTNELTDRLDKHNLFDVALVSLGSWSHPATREREVTRWLLPHLLLTSESAYNNLQTVCGGRDKLKDKKSQRPKQGWPMSHESVMDELTDTSELKRMKLNFAHVKKFKQTTTNDNYVMKSFLTSYNVEHVLDSGISLHHLPDKICIHCRTTRHFK